MYIVTAANDNKNYPKLVDRCVESAESFGYKVLLYDLGGLGKGDDSCILSSRNQILACWQKPRVIWDAVNKIPEGELLAWVDADVQFVKPIDLDDGSFDVCLLVRDAFNLDKELPGTQFDQKVNSGAMFLYNNDPAKQFIEDWIARFPLQPPRGRKSLWKYGDQKYLNEMLIEYWGADFYYDEIGTKLVGHTLVYGEETYVRFVKTHDYSNYELGTDDKIPESVKILHFKGETLR